jgi:adenylyltransferase/sulfurtransferase
MLTPGSPGFLCNAHTQLNSTTKGFCTVKIFIPTPLRVYVNKQDAVQVNANTVGEALSALTSQHPDLKKHLYSDEGKLRAFVNVYLNDEDVRYLPEKEATQVKEEDSLSIIPSIAGGCQPHGR